MKPQSIQLVREIRLKEKRLARLNEANLKEQSLRLKYQVMCGYSQREAIINAYSLVCETVNRIFGFRLHDVQILGGIQLYFEKVAEMKTGEGKTLTAALPAYLHALAGKGAHVVTVNDYLATRDHETLSPVYSALGISSGVVQTEFPAEKRAESYRSEITYASLKELGFDFLRDRMRKQTGESSMVIPPLYFCLVDEADSLLMDEARTPLIIGVHDLGEKSIMDGCYRWVAKHSKRFIENSDYKYNKSQRRIDLTYQGRALLRHIPPNEESTQISFRQLCELMEMSIKVDRDIVKEKQYDVIDGNIVIIDEYTGRPAEGRQWQDGIHQIIEAKEGLEINPPTKPAAMITVQDLIMRYPKMAGMTGTAITSKREFRRAYKKSVVSIPCHRPVNRNQYATLILPTMQAKLSKIVEETIEILNAQRAILIGTRSVEFSEQVSKSLSQKGIVHTVLNSRSLEQEASIVADAGKLGAVTVATNMAGRGTDIKLDNTVRRAGGLHVLLTEIHESQRIDWQLIGRGARQGDPGSFRIVLSAEDEILNVGLSENELRKCSMLIRQNQISRAFSYFQKAQKKIEYKHLIDRIVLMRQNKERYKMLVDAGQDPLLI